MKSLVDFILESKQGQEEYFAEMLLCEKNSEVVKTIVKEFVNNPNDKFTAFGNRADLRSIAESLELDDEWIKKFKYVPDVEDLIEGQFKVKQIKNLSGTNFTKCSIAKGDTMIGVEAIIEVAGEGEYSFLVVFEILL
jgi:hypothetical protein